MYGMCMRRSPHDGKEEDKESADGKKLKDAG
jgi:hypothetical protein